MASGLPGSGVIVTGVGADLGENMDFLVAALCNFSSLNKVN